ncbi:MAG: hypothetical protein AAFY41_14055, partial [Bacteroidota bacterium]
MSRLDDLLDLTRTACDVYLINPDRNRRSAYIQIDDICELAMKSWLQANVANWSAMKSTNRYKNFHDIIKEVKGQTTGKTDLHDLLDQIQTHRDNRNHFFHDQKQSGLTIDDRRCQDAFVGLFGLLRHLYGSDFEDMVQVDTVLQAYIAIFRLRNTGHQTRLAQQTYDEYLNESRDITVKHTGLGYEVILLYEDPRTFVESLREAFQDKVFDFMEQVDEIDEDDSKDSSKKAREKNV